MSKKTIRAPDGYRYHPQGPFAEAHRRVDALAAEVLRKADPWRLKPKDLPAAREILAAAPEEQVEVMVVLASRVSRREDTFRPFLRLYQGLMQQLLRRELPLTAVAAGELLATFRNADIYCNMPWPLLAAAVERLVAAEGLPPILRKQLKKTCSRMEQQAPNAATRRAVLRLAKLAGESPLPIAAGEPWGDAAVADVEAMEPALAGRWVDLFGHAVGATASKPSRRWRQTAAKHLETIGREEFKRRVLAWFPLVEQPRSTPPPVPNWERHDLWVIHSGNVTVLKGLVWCCAGEDRELARALTALAGAAYRKVPAVGARCIKLGNACVHVLGEMGLEGVGQLAVLKARVKLRNVQRGIDKALRAAAEREGVSREDLEEMAIPAYGLTEVGRRIETLGDYRAELAVEGARTLLKWHKDDGKGGPRTLKSVPRAVREGFAGELKELRAAARDVQKMVAAQRDRLDQLHLRRKRWRYPLWQTRYLDHPLVGSLARRLIWRFSEGERTADGIWGVDGLVDVAGEPLTGLGDEVEVELWHPIGEPPERVAAWRRRLERLRVVQPFKQAHRELYLLTDAERRTGTYSNRFAAHIIKQHQFNALCGVRGWRNVLRLMVDDVYPPASLELPAWGLRAEFWVEGAGDEYGVDTNDAGTYLHLATDQVRFYPLAAPEHYAHAWDGGYGGGAGEGGEPLAVAGVPPLVFSEVMRDVDLFVGVASVGNDPTWEDGGPAGRYRDYWQSYSFGELSATAKTRRELLESLVPRLKIAERCSFEDRFLVVRGELNRYKIHLASGNVLMAPGDRYLCILPAHGAPRGPAARVFLPFEGDRALSIILSKAFLLAADTAIQDATIVSQLRRGSAEALSP